jgi:hypothetical protein
MNFILKNPVILLIPALIIWVFASSVIIPIEEISTIIPLIFLGGFFAYSEKDKKLQKLFLAVVVVVVLMMISILYNSSKIMRNINADRYQQMDTMDILDWKYGLNEKSKEYSFYRYYDDNGEKLVEWF